MLALTRRSGCDALRHEQSSSFEMTRGNLREGIGKTREPGRETWNILSGTIPAGLPLSFPKDLTKAFCGQHPVGRPRVYALNIV